MPNPVQPAMKTAEVATLFDCTPKHIRDLANAGKIPAFRVGTCWRYPRARIYSLAGIDCDGNSAEGAGEQLG